RRVRVRVDRDDTAVEPSPAQLPGGAQPCDRGACDDECLRHFVDTIPSVVTSLAASGGVGASPRPLLIMRRPAFDLAVCESRCRRLTARPTAAMSATPLKSD